MNIWPKLRGNHHLVYLGGPRRNSGTQSPAPKPGDDAPFEDDATDRKFLKSTPTSPIAPAPSIPAKKPRGSPKFIKPSIAAATIVGIIFMAGGVFLLVWYILRERRARRLRGMQTGNQSQDPFCQSTLTLNEDSDRTLNEFLMKDLRPERTSLMFNNSLSPSFTLLVNETNNHPSTSTNSLSKVDSTMTITPVITEESQSSFVVSDITETNTSSPASSPETPKASATPRLSMASTEPSTARSSQLWTTTTGTTTATVMTELSSLLDNPDPGSSRASQSTPRPTDEPPPSDTSDLITHLSSSSCASSRFSRSVTRPKSQSSYEQRSERRERTSSHHRSESTVSSPTREDLSAQSSSLITIPPASSPLFRLSGA